jgi:twitching motility protein PilT
MNTPAVANSIREGKSFMLPGIMQTGKAVGMITMDDSLKKLYNAGLISQEECLSRCADIPNMKKHFKI